MFYLFSIYENQMAINKITSFLMGFTPSQALNNSNLRQSSLIRLRYFRHDVSIKGRWFVTKRDCYIV